MSWISNFWENILSELDSIEILIKSRKVNFRKLAMQKLDRIRQSAHLDIQLYVSIGSRNGMDLKERENHIELILSTGGLKTNKKIIQQLYDVSSEYMPKNWTVVKYKLWHKALLNTTTVNIMDKNDKLIEISQNDFRYFPIVQTNCTFDMHLFINAEIHKHIIHEKKISGRLVWVPKNTCISTILESAIGEFNMINILNKIDIHPSTSHDDIPRYDMEHLSQIALMVSANLNNDVLKSCGRCRYTDVNITLKLCRCKKTYYCDIICQRAHRSLHKSSCHK